MTYTVEIHTPRGAPARFLAREGTSDLSILGSTYAGVAGSPLVDEYHLAGTFLSGRFVDIGAHVGSVAIAVLLDNPDTSAILVEPVPENVEMIRANLEANGLTERATIIVGAVGTDTIDYQHTGSETAETNRYIGNLTASSSGSRITVARVTLADLLPCEAMKLDCEGGEWSLLADPAIRAVPLIFGEYHGGPGAKGVRAALSRTHRITFDAPGEPTGGFRAVRR